MFSSFAATGVSRPLCGHVLRFKFTTFDLLFWQAVTAVVVVQFTLCYDAMVCRGYPPITEVAFNKQLVSPLLVCLPAVVGTRVNRMRGVMAMAISITLFWAMIYVDDDIRPSTGSTHGPAGIVRFYFAQLVFVSVLAVPFVFTALHFFERVAGDMLRLICFQRTERLTFSETWERAWGRKLPPKP